MTTLQLTDKEFEVIRMAVAVLLGQLDKIEVDKQALESIIEKFTAELGRVNPKPDDGVYH